VDAPQIDWNDTGKLLILLLVLGVLFTATIVIAINVTSRKETTTDDKRCTYLARLLSSELNRPDAVDLIRSRCLQSK
jgi:flagellar basal body-associated protein FliL